MSIIVSYDGTPISHDFDPSGLNITHRADMGEASFGGIPLEDPSASLTMVGHKPLIVEEDDCSQPRLFTGWTTQRDIKRDPPNALLAGLDQRLQDLTVVDMQAAFGFRQITGADGNRPAETWQARCTWILQSDYLDDAISHSEDFIVTNTTAMDAADYRGSTPSAVMDDLSDRSGGVYTYFLFWDPAAAAITLFFDNDTESIGLSTLSISNVLADVDYVAVFPPDNVAVMAREPDQTYSEVVVVYNDGTQKLFRKRPATETAFIRRGTQIERPYTKSLATATSQADKWLTKHSVEVDRITCSIQVPSSAAGLVQAGQSIAVRFSHMPGYESGATMRVVSCSPKPTNDVADFYTLDLELVGTPTTPICCIAETPTPSGYYPPMGGRTSDATGNVVYFKAGDSAPTRPAPGHVGSFHFPNWQYAAYDPPTPAVPTGWVDGPFGDATNAVICYVVGAGEITVHTKRIFANGGYGTRTYRAAVYHENPRCTSIEGDVCCEDLLPDEDRTGIPVGTDAVFTIDPCSESCASGYYAGNLEGFCYHAVYLWELDPASPGAAGHGGFAGFTWVSSKAGGGDTVIPLPPTPGATTTHTVDPTVDDDAAAGYTVGSHWINTTTGHEFVLVDSTTGAAVWASTTAISVFSFATSDGTTTVDPTTELTFVGATLADLGGGVAEVTWSLPSGTPGGELGGTWASPTVDATHSGSAHLALGSTSSTAAAGDHTHAGGELLVADGTSGDGDNVSSYVEMTTPRTTTSGTLEDITGATTTITLQTTSHIVAWLNCHVSASAVCDYGLAINFDGTDHDETVEHLTTVDEGNVGIVHRTTTTLPPGTYTVKGRHRRISGGGTPETDRADLLVMAMGHAGPIMLTTEDETDYLYADL